MSVYVGWRLLKLLAVTVLFTGVAGVVTRGDTLGRVHAAHRLVTPGFLFAWIAGYALMKETERSMGEPFVAASLVLSLAGFVAALTAAHRRAATRWPEAIAVGSLLATGGLMAARGHAVWVLALVAGLSALTGVLIAEALRAAHSDPTPAPVSATWTWLRTLARLEGLSLIVLLLIATPLKYTTGFLVDGGTGLLGWTHGALLIAFAVALPIARVPLGWSWGRVATGLAASLVPFGTFLFEARVSPARLDTAPATLTAP